MKKIIASILAVLYLSTSAGTTVYMHYCMGKLADWGLGHNKSETCSNCGMEKGEEKDNGCCKDEHKFVKDYSDQKIAESSIQLTGMMGNALLPACTESASIKILSLAEVNPVSNAPPRNNGIAVYILNRTFLI